MRKITNINSDWQFAKGDLDSAKDFEGVNLPFTWNAKDGQDGGDDYYRGTYTFKKALPRPELTLGEELYIEFKGVNSSSEIFINGTSVAKHDGGYSTFRANLTPHLKEENELCVTVDNSKTEKVYPQTADFTFYGGIYRDVNLITVDKNRFDMDFYGSCGMKIDPVVCGNNGTVTVTAYVTGDGEVKIEIYDADGKTVGNAKNGESVLIENVNLWNGLESPYLYKACASLIAGGKEVERIEKNFGFRTISVHPKKGFYLNGKSYPLRGVSRHQDRKDKGNAISRADHEEDIALILESGANTVRLAHYQHDDYFYDLCDRYGLVVWAEIPYISRHMTGANENAEEQLKELIFQQYNHPCIAVWGISNEITMFKKHKKDMLKTHKKLNALAHELDPSRLTTLACYAVCSPFNRSAHITDLVSWNLYLGWYVPGLFLNKLWFGFFRFIYPKRVIGLSEYGAEGMPNLHSKHPRRGDNTEEYQAKYHEYMAKFISKRPYLWATHVWNMFDFAADARNQGGEPGMNHKGLITFDRKIKKDSFYIYKAYWSEEPFVHICGKRFTDRTGNTAKIKVYSNLSEITLYVNGEPVCKKHGKKVFAFKIKLSENTHVKAVSGEHFDECTLHRVKKANPEYKLKSKSYNQSWQK